MGGGWFGYIVSIFTCGLVLSLIAGSTAVLYGWARMKQRKRGRDVAVSVRSLPPALSDDAAPEGAEPGESGG